MHTRLGSLPPGTRFKVVGLDETGVLVMANECRALVRTDKPTADVEFTNADGETRQFKCRRSSTTSWAPSTIVEPIGFDEAVAVVADTDAATDTITHFKTEPKEQTMSRSKKTTAAAKKTTAAETVVASKAPATPAKKTAKTDGKMSALDAAAAVLGDSTEPMATKAMIEAMAQKKLWSSPGGKTPHATLYSAILREIAIKGNESRFEKAERGHFRLTGAAIREGGTASAEPDKKPAANATNEKKATRKAMAKNAAANAAEGTSSVAEMFRI